MGYLTVGLFGDVIGKLISRFAGHSQQSAIFDIIETLRDTIHFFQGIVKQYRQYRIGLIYRILSNRIFYEIYYL